VHLSIYEKPVEPKAMSQYLYIHPDNPQQRLINLAVDILNQNGVIIYPTDACYAIGCKIGDKHALDRIRKIRKLDEQHQFTLMCRDLSELGVYAKVNDTAFRMLKHLIPGPYTFLLPASKEVPRRLLHSKRKSIGIRIPDHPILQLLLTTLGEPLLTTTLLLPNDEYPMQEPDQIRDCLSHQVDCIIDAGYGDLAQTTVIDMRDLPIQIVRLGKGDVSEYFDISL